MKMPVCFIGHGSPMNAIEDNLFTQQWKDIIKDIHPKAILIFSAHWESNQFEITSNPHPKMIYDMFGFPNELYTINYPAFTDQSIINRCKEILPDLVLNDNRGYDHGTWSILVHMLPRADLPVIQLSLNRSLSFEDHYSLGKKLNVLRNEGVLILGSGNIIHNLRELDWANQSNIYPWAHSFHTKIHELILQHKDEEIVNYNQLGQEAIRCINSGEHYLPFIVCLGASQNDPATFYNDIVISGSLSMTCILWK